jgi:hypothetical protein
VLASISRKILNRKACQEKPLRTQENDEITTFMPVPGWHLAGSIDPP